MSAQRLEVLYDYVLIEPVVEDVTKAGLIIPDSVKDKLRGQIGKVRAIGPGRFEGGHFFEPPAQVGDFVVYGSFAGSVIEIPGSGKFVIMRFLDLFARLAPPEEEQN